MLQYIDVRVVTDELAREAGHAEGRLWQVNAIGSPNILGATRGVLEPGQAAAVFVDRLGL